MEAAPNRKIRVVADEGEYLWREGIREVREEADEVELTTLAPD